MALALRFRCRVQRQPRVDSDTLRNCQVFAASAFPSCCGPPVLCAQDNLLPSYLSGRTMFFFLNSEVNVISSIQTCARLLLVTSQSRVRYAN